MQKTMKRTLALILALMLCLSGLPFSAFAAEPLPDEPLSSEAPPSEAPAESSQPGPSAEPSASPAPVESEEPGSPEPGPAPESTSSPAPSADPDASPEPSAEPESIFDTELSTVEAYQVWPSVCRAKARAGVGTVGVLQIGYYCFSSAVGMVPTLGEYVSEMPAKTMVMGGTHVAAYCLEHQKSASSDTPYTWTDLSVSAQDTVGTVLALGFQWNAGNYWTGPSDNGDKWAVTQMLIWEAINGHITLKNGLYSVAGGVDTDMERCAPHAYNSTKFMDYYRDLKKRLQDYMAIPSFANKEPGKAEPITLRWDGSKYSATVTDTNKVLDNFRFEACLSGVKITTSGNKLTLSTTSAILSPKTSSAVTNVDSRAGGKGAVAVWRTSDRSQQDCATYNATGGEPVKCYIKVKTDAVGSAGLVKTSEDGKVEGIQFQITGSDGSSVTKTTDANGNIDIDGLPIYAADGSKITYTATEINVPNKYVKPQSQTFQLTEGQTASIRFENKLKRWRVTVTKADNKTGSTPQGNATLKGATFGVYQGGTLVKEYTVGDDLSFTTDYFPYGEDWSLKEISAGEGYKVSSVVTDLCEIPSGSNDEFNDNTATVTNEVIRGGVSVEKRDSKTGERPQGNANFAGIVFEIINNSANPVEVDGKVVAPEKVAKEITTDAQGFATTGPNCLPYGDYIIREKATNASMRKTFTEEIPVTVSEDGKVYPFTAENDVVRGGIAIQKRDSQTGETPQGNADFAGIVFEFVNSSANPVVVGDETYAPGAVVTTMTTDDNGYASTEDELLPYGRYTVREKSTNASMLLTFREQTVDVTEDKKVYNVFADNDVVRGGLSVQKLDSKTGEKPQGDADFAGIVFEIINDSRNPVIVNDKSIAPGEVALTLTTDSEGKASTAPDALPYGAYILHESATNESMLNTAPDQPVEVAENGKIYPFFMHNEVVRGGVLIEKRDLESLLLTPLGGASLDGTLFEVTNKSRNAVYVDGALYQPDEVCLTIEVKDGIAQSDVRALPYGSYTLAESKPGTGYLWTDKTIRPFDVLIDGSVKEYREGEAAYNQVKRGDLRFVKVGEKNMHRFANVAFKLTSQTTGESHILVTDENGEVRTETAWNPHTQNTNGNDDKPETEWDNLTGTWFGLTTEDWMVETQDGLCALPYDYYRLEELRCEGNKGYALVTVPNIFISRDSTVIELGTIDDHEEGTPEIGTTATVDGEKIAEPLSKVTIVDTVRYSGLTVGKTYKLSGVLMDKSSNAPLLVDGQKVTAEKGFTPEQSSGTEEITFTFDASALAGKAVVVFEDLYEGDAKVTSHADIEDEGQTVTFTEPKIGTTATVGGEHTAQPVGEITIIDTVKYSGLIPGKEYTVKGVLMDKATGKALMVDGKEITAEATFRANKEEGTIDIPFTFDASALAGKTVVVFETLYRDKLEVCAHADIEDKEQTVTFSEKPEIKTTATVNGEKETDPLDEVTITDKITYTGLTPGKPYRISGVLMDKSTSKALVVDGKEVTASADFTPENAKGSLELAFTFNASTLAGKSIVVFETLYQDSVEVFVHADLGDKNQTISIRGRGGLVIKKTAEDNFVEGISFLVTGKDYSKKFKTNKDGEIRVEGLAPGKYTVTEISDKATARYEIQEGKTVTVTTGDIAEVKFHNKLLRGQIVGRKTDTEGTPLEGVTFGLFAKDAKEFTADKAIATAKTDKAGKFQFMDVPYGDYQIKELEALPGYVMLTGIIPVKVDSRTVTLEDIQNAKTQIVVSKIDSATGKELPGAKLEIKDKDGKVADSWTSTDKPHTIEKMPAGEYTLHEVSAPKGYELAEDIKFTVKDSGEAITIVMKDKPSNSVETPQTGDRGWPLALAIFAVGLGGVVISLVLSRKKKDQID